MSTPAEKTQRKLLRDVANHVYGPYTDLSILQSNKLASGNLAVLNEVEFYLNGKQIGLDDTEYINKPVEKTDMAGNKDIMVFGILEIESLDWISPRGKKYLEEDVREWDEDTHDTHGQSKLTLQAIYGQGRGDGYTLKVRIACVKRLLVSNISKDHPGYFILTVATENRKFCIGSIHPISLARSRAFIERASLRLLIEKLIQEDENKTPIHRRDFNWLVAQYYKTILPQSASPDLRFIAPFKAKSKDKSKPQAPEIPGLRTERRFVRHLAHGHLRGIVAEHADWLVATQVVTASKNAQQLYVPSWKAFCKAAREDSIDAKKRKVPWGIFHSDIKAEAPPNNLARSLARFGDTEQNWAKWLRLAEKRASRQKQEKGAAPESEDDAVPGKSSYRNFQYDSDFSEPSTVYESDDESVPKGDTVASSQIPPFLFQAPILPPGSFDWRCPDQSCEFSLDFLALPPSILSTLSPHQRQFIVNKNWTSQSAEFQSIFHGLVSQHYESHLKTSGFKISETANGTWRLESLNPRMKNLGIKQEE